MTTLERDAFDELREFPQRYYRVSCPCRSDSYAVLTHENQVNFICARCGDQMKVRGLLDGER